MPTTERQDDHFYWTNEGGVVVVKERVAFLLGDVCNFASRGVIGSSGWTVAVALSRRCFRCMNKGLDGVVGSAQSVGGEQAGCLQ